MFVSRTVKMEETDGPELIEETCKGTHDTVIDDLENVKMEVLNSNASTATLNMQNFGGEDYQHRDEVISSSATVDGSFEGELFINNKLTVR